MAEKSVHNRLRHVSPLIYWISWGYALTNQLIGLGLWHTSLTPLHYVYIHGAINEHFYAILFILTGIIGGIGLILNKWSIVRRIMMFGLAIKSLFFYALLLNVTYQTLGVLAIWTLIFWVQFLTVVYFPKVRKNGIV